MQLKRLDHVALVCADTEASRGWYQSVLGMEWVFQGQWGGNPCFLRKGESYLALFQAGRSPGMPARPDGPRIDHFAFLAASRGDYEQAKLELREKGLSFKEQDHEISLSLYLEDPDGHTVEITTYDLG